MKGVHAWTLVEGRFREGADVPVSDRGFRYGMSAFETVAVRNGRMLFLEEHLLALSAACRAAGFQAETARAINELADLPDGLLRIYVTAGDGALAGSISHQRTFAYFEPAEFPSQKEITRGFRLGITRTPFVPVLDGWKTGNYWPNVRALSLARENGFDETLIVNIERVVISAAMANVFFLMRGHFADSRGGHRSAPGSRASMDYENDASSGESPVARGYQRSRGMLSYE